MGEVQCQVAKVVMSESHERQLVILEETHGDRRLSIIIGFPEVFAIHRFINDEAPPRPLTHELIGNIFNNLDVHIQKIVIHDIQNGTFYAGLFLQHEGRIIEVDSRPSDAIALATHLNAPIFVEEDVLEQSSDNPI